MPAHSVPPQHQTNPEQLPGQIVNPLPSSLNHDMMDDQSLYAMMNSRPRDRTLGDYVRRKSDGVSAEEKAALLDGAFKPCRDLPQGWDHV